MLLLCDVLLLRTSHNFYFVVIGVLAASCGLLAIRSQQGIYIDIEFSYVWVISSQMFPSQAYNLVVKPAASSAMLTFSMVAKTKPSEPTSTFQFAR